MNPISSLAETPKLKPMALGLLIRPFGAPEATIKRVHDMGFSNCFLSLDGYINKFTVDAAKQIEDSLAMYGLVATTVEVVGPEPLKWNFLQGPATIGVVPPKTREARIDALKQVSDFAKRLGLGRSRRTADSFRRIRRMLCRCFVSGRGGSNPRGRATLPG